MYIEEKRTKKIERLKQFFLEKLVEDSQDGTILDCDILDVLDNLKEKYTGE